MTVEETTPRFRSPQAALRFYFRASELIADNPEPGIFSKRSASQAYRPPSRDVICDFLSLDACFRYMNEVQVWLLKELYGPKCFGTPQRRVAELYRAARQRFPKWPWTPNLVQHFKQHALDLVEEHLKRQRLM